MSKRYSAGAIFLQVVPVFRRVQEDIAQEAEGWNRVLGDKMEKGGAQAGERAGKAMSESMDKELKKGTDGYAGHFETQVQRMVKNAQKELDRLDLSTASEKMLRDLERAKAKLKELSDQNFNVDFNSKEIIADVQAVKAAVDGLLAGKHELNVDANLRQVLKDAERIEKIYDEATRDRTVEIKTDVDTKPAERKMGDFERNFRKVAERISSQLEGSMHPGLQKIQKDFEALKDVKIGVDMSSTRARAEFKGLMAELDAISQKDVTIDAKFEATRAFAEAAAFNAVVDKIDGRKAKVTVEVNDKGALSNLLNTKRNADEAANSFRSFNIILLAAASIGPAIVPVLAAVAGGLLAIGPAAAAAAGGIGAALIGFSGLGTALQALQARQKMQGMIAQTAGKRNDTAGTAIRNALAGVKDAELNAARATEDAARRVADAKRQAADAIRSALEQQANAQRSYAQSVADVQQAEADLRQARKDAAGTGHTLKDKIKDNSLAITQAQLNSASATNNYNAVMADGSSTNTDRIAAKLGRDQALQALHELRDEQKALAKEKKKWDEQGVNGTDQVQSAQDALTSAIQQQQDAYRSLRDAARNVDQARQEGARNVARAIEDQNRTLADNARNIAKADQALRDARKGQGQAFDQMSSQQNAVNAAFAALGPAGKKFALFLFDLQNRFQKWRQGLQAAMLPSIQQAIEGFIGSKSAGFLSKWIMNMARGFGQFTKALSKSFQGPVWTEFFKTMAKYGPALQKAYGQAFIKIMEAFASLLTTLAPFALQFARGVARLATAFADWAKSQAGQEAIARFLAYFHEVGPRVLKLVGLLALALLNIMEALAPYAGMILDMVISILDFLAHLDVGALGAFLSGLLAVITASQIAYAVMNTMMAGAALFATAVGLATFALVGMGLAVFYVYKHHKTLGIILGIVVGAIAAVVGGLYAYIAVTRLWAAWQLGVAAATYGTVGATYAQAGATKAAYVATKIWMGVQKAATLVMAAFNAVMDANPIALIILAIIALVVVIVILWKKNDAFRNAIIKAWDAIKVAFSAAWDVVGKVIGWIGDGVMWLWNVAIKPALSAMGRIFLAVFKVISWAWHHILWPIIKTYAKVWWTVWKTVIKVALVLMAALFKAVFVAIKWVWEHVLRPVFHGIAVGAKWLYDKGIKPAADWIGQKWDDLMTGMKYAWDHWLAPVFNAIRDKVLPKLKGAFETTVDAIKTAWDGLKAVVAKPIKFVIDKIINHGLIDGFNKIADWVHMDGFDYVKMPASLQSYATGGIMPGYTPGRDPHKFVSPTGGRLELSGGEAVMRPEWTAAMGAGYVNHMNALARQGGVGAIKKAMGFATGGITKFAKGGVFDPDDKVYINGMAISRVAAAQVALARQKSGIPIYMMQGGFGGNNVAASGSSHNYPGVGDFGPGSIALEKVMRQVGFAAWARNVAGRSSVGSGAHVHAVSLLDPKDAGSPQVYGSWANHGNGLSGANNDPAPHYSWIPGLISKVQSMGIGQIASLIGADGKGGHASIPGAIKQFILHPLDTIKGFVSGAWSKASDFVTQSPMWGYVKHVPENLAHAAGDMLYSKVPGWAKDTLGVAKNIGGAIKEGASDLVHGAGHLAGQGLDAIGLANGGILPYNGTMMYDNGGYLAPGLTTVMNLTGKPEPVFTNDQWAQMGGGAGGGNIHYEPHFEGSNLTPEDVAGDLNFTFRRIKRGGKYAGVGQ